MENKKIEQLNDQELEKVNGGAEELKNGGAEELKGNRNYNPLSSCPVCGGRGQTAYADGRMYFVCNECYRCFWFEDDGSLQRGKANLISL